MHEFSKGLAEATRTAAVGLILLTATPLMSQPYSTALQNDQYKRRSQDVFAQIVEGDLNEAQQLLSQYQADYPGDVEALFVGAVLHGVAGRPEEALRMARAAVTAGLPPGRFLAGPRASMSMFTSTQGWRDWLDSLNVNLVHGPMLGNLAPTGVDVWVRTGREADVRVVARATGPAAAVVQSETVRTDAQRDFSAVVKLRELEPETRYWYQLEIDGAPIPGTWLFETPVRNGEASIFRIGFGGGAGFTPWHERIWSTIASRNPLSFLLLGDNVYIDHPEEPEIQRYTYFRRQSVPQYRQLVASTPIFSIWDDHDFTTDDGWGGPEVDEPAWKRDVWNLYRQNWANPSYGGGDDMPGVWYRFSIGDVEFFMLDGRYYRQAPGDPAPRSMLGPQQKAWLLAGLAASEAVFKVIASPVPWAEGTKPGSLDTWDGYAEEREEIFRLIGEQRIEGVILLSADRHRSDIWRIPRPGAYDLYEFESSRLTNVHFHEVMPGAEFGYNQKCSFGLLTFDTSGPEAEVTYEIVNIDNETVHSFTLPLGRLTFGPD